MFLFCIELKNLGRNLVFMNTIVNVPYFDLPTLALSTYVNSQAQ